MKTKKFNKFFLALALISGSIIVLLFMMAVPVEKKEGFPIDLNSTSLSYPVVIDLYTDGYKEIGVVDREGKQFIVVDHNGKIMPPYYIGDENITDPYVADLDNDGKSDIIAIGYSSDSISIYILNNDGTAQAWYVLAGSEDPIMEVTGPSLVDFGNDSENEIVFAAVHEKQIEGKQEPEVKIYVVKDGGIVHSQVLPEKINNGEGKKILSSIAILPEFPELMVGLMVIKEDNENPPQDLLLEGLKLYVNFDDQNNPLKDLAGEGDILEQGSNEKNVKVVYNDAIGSNVAMFTANDKTYLKILPEQQIELADITADGDVTILAKVHALGYPEGGFTIAAKQSGPSAENVDYSFYLSNGHMSSWNGSTNVYVDFQIPNGEWHHVSMVRQGNNITFYLDGIPHGPFGQIFTQPAEDAPLYIGYNGLSAYANGLIDELSIFGRALTPKEIQTISQSGIPIVTDNVEPVPASGPGVVFTCNNKLIGLAPVDQDEDGYLNTFGKIDLPNANMKQLGEPKVIEGDILVAGVGVGDDLPTLSRYEFDNGIFGVTNIKALQKPDSIIRTGNISFSYLNEDGILDYIVPFHIILNGGEVVAALICSTDGSGNLVSLGELVWNKPFDTSHLEIVSTALQFNAEKKHFCFLGNKGKSMDSEIELDFQMEEGEYGVNSALANLDGGDAIDIIICSNLGKLYAYESEQLLPGLVPIRIIYPMHKWEYKSPDKNNPPEILEPGIGFLEFEIGEEKEIKLWAVDKDIDDVLKYIAGVIIPNTIPQFKVEGPDYDEEEQVWKIKLKAETAGEVELKVTVKDVFSFADKFVNIKVSAPETPPVEPLENPSISITPKQAPPAPVPGYTNIENVKLNLGIEGGGNIEMKVGEDLNIAIWEAYTGEKDYTLSIEDGVKTIYAKFKNGAGETGPVSASITLDKTAPIFKSVEYYSLFTNKTPTGVSCEFEEKNLYSAKINGQAAEGVPGKITSDIPLKEGPNPVVIEIQDKAGNISNSNPVFNIVITLDTVKPVINLTSPSDNLITDKPKVKVSGSVEDINLSFFEIAVNGIEKEHPESNTFDVLVDLKEGDNVITVWAYDKADNYTLVTREVTYNKPLLPDLTVSKVLYKFRDVKVYLRTNQVKYYKKVEATIKNIGAGPTPAGKGVVIKVNCTLKYQMGLVPTKTYSQTGDVPGVLEAGKTALINFLIPKDIFDKGVKLEIMVDPQMEIKESNDFNNYWQKGLV